MNAPLPLTDFMRAVDRQIVRRRRDRLDVFRDYVDALDRDTEARKVGKRDPYFDNDTFRSINSTAMSGADYIPPDKGGE